MKSLTCILIFFLLSIAIPAIAQEQNYFNPFLGYEHGDTLYSNHNNTILYSKADTSSKISARIPIDQEVLMDETIETNYDRRQDPNQLYRVKYKGKSGYIRAMDLAFYRLIHVSTETHFLFSYTLPDEDGTVMIKCFEVQNKQLVNTYYFDPDYSSFSLHLTDPRGLEDVDAMLVVDHLAEACGMNGGDDFYLWSPGEMILLASLYEVGDGGVYYRTEKFIFPGDEGGIPGKIIFEAEEFNSYDEDTEWTATTQERRIYTFSDKGLIPAFNRSPEE